MKQLAIITAALIALAGCATSSADKVNMDTATPTPVHNHSHDHHHNHANKNHVTYACSGHPDTHVHAEYTPNSDVAILSITAHSLGLDHQKVMLQQAVAASGTRYVNALNPNTVYEWHTKGNYGLLTITTPTGEYQRDCHVSTKEAVH